MTRKYRFMYYTPHLNTIYAGRTIMTGYKNAIIDMGHDFKFLSSENTDMNKILEAYTPDFFMMGLSHYSIKYLDLSALIKAKKRGTKVLVNTPFWISPFHKTRINESPSLKDDSQLLKFITSQNIGDFFYNVCEQGDARMDGFAKVTGHRCHTIPLAADKITLNGSFHKAFESDIAYIGTNLPQKRRYFRELLFPLKDIYNVKLYGQDWTLSDRLLGWVQRGGQYFNIPYARNIQKPKLKLEDEAHIYASAKISVNIHEDYQKEFGGDTNERTFKIPFCNGFEITDNISCIRKYYKDGVEIIIARNTDDWFDKISYYMKNPEKRNEIIRFGKLRTLKNHTYHNRVQYIIDNIGNV